MDLVLKRTRFIESGIYGRLETVEGKLLCYTLEHSYIRTTYDAESEHTKVLYQPKLPPGTYRCVRGPHRLKSGPLETFEVMKVPGRTGILFHRGNYQKDSEGCILVGLRMGDDSISMSTGAFEDFLLAQAGKDEFFLEVK